MAALIIVEGLRAVGDLDIDLTSERDLWSLALEQRMFGPRRLLVAFAGSDGDVVGIAHSVRTDPATDAFEACLTYFSDMMPFDLVAAYCDEPVIDGPPPPELAPRWEQACAVARRYGVELLDWFACDDQRFRSTRLALGGPGRDGG